ncbi:MAG: WXG100 family type VII secretion target [Butyrivibrio sp.]|nr:WXG100 family type VII secretion target [Butyrivibrio sp.]
MAILTQLRVSDVADLRAEANNFDAHATEVQKVTDKMLELVESTNSIWEGDARTRYATQFEGLRDEMKIIYDMCHEYSTDLLEIAKNYESAETQNISTANSLKASVQLVQ